MKATEARLLDFLKKSPQFIIPIYQRTYSWTESECGQLWDDILRIGKNDDVAAHFVGSIVYIEDSLYQVSSQSSLLVIDGQQRLTTLTLIIEALARHLGDSEPIDGFTPEKLRHYYLLNHLEKDERKYKLLLAQADKKTLLAIVDQKDLPAKYSLRLKGNFEFFEQELKKLGTSLEPLCRGLMKLMIVDISLSRDQDNPQLIFESMNSTGLELTQADLIRNFILMGLEPSQQTTLYYDHWLPIEVSFGQEAYGKEFDRFMRYYLTVKTSEIPNVKEVYEAFKAHARSPEIAAAGVDALVADIHAFAGYYCAMALGQEPSTRLAAAFRDLREFKVNVAYPFLLKLYSDYVDGRLSGDGFERIIRIVESYVFRRAVCSIPTNSLNKTFANLARTATSDNYVESMEARFLLLPSYRRFPRDDEFRRELFVRDLYNFPRRSYWLRRLENHDRKEHVSVGEYTIEHILPQNENLSQTWQEALGPNWKQIQEARLHTLGNLTLTGYNSEYGDRPFPQKRDMKGGFKDSPIRLNEGLRTLETWDEDAIEARGKRLAELATKVWVAPSLRPEILDSYRPEIVKRKGYSIADHPWLAETSPMRELFEALSQEVLAIDPCVDQEFLKLYIAHKAETNFVDVIPQKTRLLLVLNMCFHEIHDPRDECVDVTNKGRWGNGDVEVGLSSVDNLPYVMGLVRQSFEKQMGNGEVDE